MRDELPVKGLMGPRAFCLGLLLLGCLLASCSSQKKESKPDYTSLRWEQRMLKQIRDPYSIRSSFQQDVFNPKGSVKTRSYKTDKFQGEQKFSRDDEKFKAGEFAQADKQSKSGEGTFTGAEQKSRLADGTYKTSESRFGDKSANDAEKTSALGNDTFRTGANGAAMENVEKVKRPLIENQPSYSEEEVRTLLKKG